MAKRPTVKIKRGRAKPLWHGHPWVYSQAIADAPDDAAPGSIVDVVDHREAALGRGIYNPRSSIAVRLLTRDPAEDIDRAFFKRRLASAIGLRRRLGFPSEETDAYRLVNSEGDGLSGLIVDVFADAVAVQFTSLGFFLEAETIFGLLDELLAPAALFQAGGGSFAKAEGYVAEARVVSGREGPVDCRELGLTYRGVDPVGGQKTGMFLDQRQNRARVAPLASGARVLDLYTYVGGFALNAARAGAKEVVAVDASARALERAAVNAEANRLDVTFVEADAVLFLDDQPAGSAGLVIVDPPKFARSRKHLDPALKAYRKLNRLAMRALKPGGILVSASCSQLVGRDALERAVAAAAADLGRPVRVLDVAGAGPDHPIPPGFTEGAYLTVLTCEVAR